MVDWDNNDVFTGTGEDITSRVMYLEWERGRDSDSQLVGKSSGGRMMAVLNNESGDYSSFKTDSPIAGNILPGRKVRIETGADKSFPYTFPIVWGGNALWSGFLHRLTPQPRVDMPNVAVLEAWGPLGHMNEDKIQLAMATSKTTGTAIGEVLDEAGWPAGDRSIDTGQTTMKRYWVDRQRTLSAMRLFEETEGGFLLESRDGQVVFQDRHYRLVSPRTTSQATWSDAPGAGITYRKIDQLDELAFIYNEFEAEIQTYTVGSLAVLWTLSESGSSSPKIAPSEAKTFWARFPNPDSATDAFAVDAWTTTAATTDMTANSASGGGGTNLTSNIGIAVSKFGNSMKITLTNNHASLDAFITLLQARGTPVAADDPVRKTADDSSSQTKYGTRTFPSRARFIPDTDEGQDWADFNLSIYKDPQPIMRIEIIGNVSSGNIQEILERDLSDRITLVANNAAELWASSQSEDFFIEREHHYVIPGQMHRVVFDISPATGYSGFWTLDVSKLDTETKLAY